MGLRAVRLAEGGLIYMHKRSSIQVTHPQEEEE